MNHRLACVLVVAASAAVGLSSCSSGSSTASSPSTTSASSGGSSSGGSSSGSSGDAGAGAPSTRNLCTEVTAADVQQLTGESITSATELDGGSRVRSGFKSPSCVYKTATGLGGVSAEFVAADTYKGFTTDPVLPPSALTGVGDEAFQVVDKLDGTKVIRTYAKKGDQYLYVQIFAGTPPDKAATLTKKLLGS